MLGNLFNLMGMMSIYMLIGAFFKKWKIITPEVKEGLVNILIILIIPCNIIKSFLGDFGSGIWDTFLALILLSCAVQALTLFLGQVLFRKLEPGLQTCFKYATVTSNAGFLGNPMAQLVFGDIGLLYASIFLIPQRIVMWSIGVAFFTGGIRGKEILKKIITHPCINAVWIGGAIMMLHLPLPELIIQVMESISDCCTPLSMIVMGTVLFEMDWKSLLDKRQMSFALLRLVILPGIVWGICRCFQVDPLVAGVSVILTAMPTGSMTPILASKYHGDEVSATTCFVLTTILSILTIPIWSTLLKL